MNPLSASAAQTVQIVQDLHPALWRAHQLGRQREATVPSGFAALDAELPGAGWPHRVLTELLLAHLGVGEIRLLAPALAALAQGEGPRSVMLFDPPARLCGWALAELGVPTQQLLVVHGREGPGPRKGAHGPASADLFWALEQALKSGQIGAAVAWLPARLPGDALRRLQLAAQAHEGPVFLLRGLGAQSQPSPAPLRLGLGCVGLDTLGVRILKRRGPAHAAAVHLDLPSALDQASRERLARRQTALAVVGDAAFGFELLVS